MQYPMRDVSAIRGFFSGDEDIAFVSNREAFEEALQESSYDDLFVDRFAGDFGHCTPKGNHLIAENVADAIFRNILSKNSN